MTAGTIASALRRDLADRPEWLHRLGAIVQPDGSLRFTVRPPSAGFGPHVYIFEMHRLHAAIDRVADKYRVPVAAVTKSGGVLYANTKWS